MTIGPSWPTVAVTKMETEAKKVVLVQIVDSGTCKKVQFDLERFRVDKAVSDFECVLLGICDQYKNFTNEKLRSRDQS